MSAECRMCGGSVEEVGEIGVMTSPFRTNRTLFECSKCGIMYPKPPPPPRSGGYNVSSIEERVGSLEPSYDE